MTCRGGNLSELVEMVRYVFTRRAKPGRCITPVPQQSDERKEQPLKLDAQWVPKHTAIKIFSKPCFPQDISVMSIQLTHLKLCKLYPLIFNLDQMAFPRTTGMLFSGPHLLPVHFPRGMWADPSPVSDLCRQPVSVHPNIPRSKRAFPAYGNCHIDCGRRAVSLCPDFCDGEWGLAGLLCQGECLNSLFCIYSRYVSVEQDGYLLQEAPGKLIPNLLNWLQLLFLSWARSAVGELWFSSDPQWWIEGDSLS